jgi:hypothetical protein
MTSYFIYFIGESPYLGRVKIGKSCNVNRRIYELQTGNANKLAILNTIQFSTKSQMDFAEKTLHMMLWQRRVSGEWFRLTSPEISAAQGNILLIDTALHSAAMEVDYNLCLQTIRVYNEWKQNIISAVYISGNVHYTATSEQLIYYIYNERFLIEYICAHARIDGFALKVNIYDYTQIIITRVPPAYVARPLAPIHCHTAYAHNYAFMVLIIGMAWYVV